jgi:hypothetical protein
MLLDKLPVILIPILIDVAHFPIPEMMVRSDRQCGCESPAVTIDPIYQHPLPFRLIAFKSQIVADPC